MMVRLVSHVPVYGCALCTFVGSGQYQEADLKVASVVAQGVWHSKGLD